MRYTVQITRRSDFSIDKEFLAESEQHAHKIERTLNAVINHDEYSVEVIERHRLVDAVECRLSVWGGKYVPPS